MAHHTANKITCIPTQCIRIAWNVSYTVRTQYFGVSEGKVIFHFLNIVYSII